jgi:large subunit ribosomal protein L21
VYALIQTGGKQYKVSEGTIVKIEKVEGEAGSNVVLDQVLMINDENGIVQIGNPLLENARITAKILEQGKNKKIIVYKYKKRKNYRRKQGHRQPYTRLLIEKIEG